MSDDEYSDVSEPVRALLNYNHSQQAMAALKYGIVPYIGYVLKDPTKSNITLLLNLLDAYSEIYVSLDLVKTETNENLIEELKKRTKEVEEGIVIEDDSIQGSIASDHKEKVTHG